MDLSETLRTIQIKRNNTMDTNIFNDYKNIAVLGMSKNPEKPAHTVPAYLVEQGFNVLPINPSAESILGRHCFKTITEVDQPIEILNVFRPSSEAVDIVTEAIERRRAKGDIRVIWLQEGITSAEAKEMAEKEGLIYIEDKCIYKEHTQIEACPMPGTAKQ